MTATKKILAAGNGEAHFEGASWNNNTVTLIRAAKSHLQLVLFQSFASSVDGMEVILPCHLWNTKRNNNFTLLCLCTHTVPWASKSRGTRDIRLGILRNVRATFSWSPSRGLLPASMERTPPPLPPTI